MAPSLQILQGTHSLCRHKVPDRHPYSINNNCKITNHNKQEQTGTKQNKRVSDDNVNVNVNDNVNVNVNDNVNVNVNDNVNVNVNDNVNVNVNECVYVNVNIDYNTLSFFI